MRWKVIIKIEMIVQNAQHSARPILGASLIFFPLPQSYNAKGSVELIHQLLKGGQLAF